MNAAIRAVVRTAVFNKLDVVGIERGYSGLIHAEFMPMYLSSVADIIQRGGTILRTARCEEFTTVEGRQRAAGNLRKEGIDGIVIIGGDGSFRGAKAFSAEHNIPCIGVPGTIDN